MTEREGKHWEIDFLRARPRKEADARALQLREAENVVSSYSKASDFLAEALQNATDAVDARRALAGDGDDDFEARVHLRFDCARRDFSVTDTGTGMSRADLDMVLTPNVSRKSGPQRRAPTSRSRGHKGVGLTFLALASNELRIRTCDGTARYDVVVEGGGRWVQGGGTTDKPVGVAVENPPDRLLGSSRYTQVTVGGVDFDEFDADLYGQDVDRLVWLLRTQTAVGHTGTLFGDVFGTPLPADRSIEVTLDYVEPDGNALETRAVPYAYATPEELVPAGRVVDLEDLESLEPAQRTERARGAAVRFVDVVKSDSGLDVQVYVFAIDGRDMQAIERRRRNSGRFFPDEWQGYYVATLGMPTGVEFRPDVIQPRTYERRMFALLQDDGLRLDLGRKTLAGRQKSKLKSVVRRAWKDRLVKVVPHLRPLAQPADEAVFRALVERARGLADLGGHMPYEKRPEERLGVLALFHELVATGNGYLPALRTMRTGLFEHTTDSILLPAVESGDEALHVLFGVDLGEIVRDLERDDGSAASADLGVVWDADPERLGNRAVDVEGLDDDRDGATHMLRLYGIGGLEQLRVIALSDVIEEGG